MLTYIGDNLRAMGFTTILYLGDSGGNRNGMHGATNALNEKYKGNPANFYHIPEYYDYRSVQEYIQNQLGIPEQIRLGGSSGWADSIHEEFGIDALMALEDPDTIRFYQRVEAGRAVINGVPLEPLETLLDRARQFLEVRTRLTVPGIDKALARAHRPSTDSLRTSRDPPRGALGRPPWIRHFRLDVRDLSFTGSGPKGPSEQQMTNLEFPISKVQYSSPSLWSKSDAHCMGGLRPPIIRRS